MYADLLTILTGHLSQKEIAEKKLSILTLGMHRTRFLTQFDARSAQAIKSFLLNQPSPNLARPLSNGNETILFISWWVTSS